MDYADYAGTLVKSMDGISAKVGVFRLDPPNSPGMYSRRTRCDSRIRGGTADASLGYGSSITKPEKPVSYTHLTLPTKA